MGWSFNNIIYLKHALSFYVCVCMHAYLHVCAHMSVQVSYMYISVHVSVCTCVCMHVCKFMHMYVCGGQRSTPWS